jgi:heat shock protein HtpX
MLKIQNQIDQNKRRTWLILALFVAFIGLAVYLISGQIYPGSSYVSALLFSLVTSIFGYLWGDKLVLNLNHARLLKNNEYPDLKESVLRLSQRAKIPQPQIHLIDSTALNAFATGRSPKSAHICLTTGILEKLNQEELDGVLAHELSHIRNFDIRLMTLVSVLVGSLSILINMSYNKALYGNEDRDKQSNGILGVIGFLLIILAPIIAQLIQLAISRQREYLADASSVDLTKNPHGLISALKKISGQANFDTASTATASLYIANPFKNQKTLSLFFTHPPVEDRIKALEKLS